MTFAERIRTTRLETGLSQQHVAERVGIRQQTLAAIETGTPTTLATARALCGVLQLGPPWPARAALEGFAAKELRDHGIPVEQTYAELAEAVREGGYLVFEPGAIH